MGFTRLLFCFIRVLYHKASTGPYKGFIRSFGVLQGSIRFRSLLHKCSIRLLQDKVVVDSSVGSRSQSLYSVRGVVGWGCLPLFGRDP